MAIVVFPQDLGWRTGRRRAWARLCHGEPGRLVGSVEGRSPDMDMAPSSSRLSAIHALALALAEADQLELEAGEWICPALAVFFAVVFAVVDRWPR